MISKGDIIAIDITSIMVISFVFEHELNIDVMSSVGVLIIILIFIIIDDISIRNARHNITIIL